MMPHYPAPPRTAIFPLLFFALITIALSILAPEATAQDMIFTTVVDDGDTINSPGPSPAPTVSSIDYAQWSGEALGIRTWDSLSRTYAGFWYPSVGELQYVAGALYPFPEFEPISPTTNREGNPPVAPRLTSGYGLVNNSGEFFVQQYVDDGGTFLVESWPTLITAGAGTGIQQFAQRFITPVAMAATEYAFYVTGIDLEDNHGWLLADGSVQILIDSDTPVPAQLNDATHFFWSNPTKILNDRTSIHIADYNGSPGGNAIYSMSSAGAINILVDSNGDVPTDPNLPEGGSWSSMIGTISVNDSGRILFYAGVSKLGEFSRNTLWSMATNSGEPTLEISNSVPYETNTVASVTFDRVNTGLIDNDGNILFHARVEGESQFGVWRKLASGTFIRISPEIGSPLPGLPDFIVKTASIVDMNTDGRCVIQIQATGSRSITAYFLESTKESLIYILAEGVPFGSDEESVSVTSLDLSDTGSVAMLLRVDVPNTYDDDDRVVIALDPDDVQPTGNKYIWDGGAGTSNWHTVVNGRSNWVDSQGVPWDVPPNSEEAQIEIGIDAVVQLDQAVQVYSVNIIEGSLELDGSVLCHGVVYVQEDASLVLQGSELDAELIVSEGLILKEGDKTSSLTSEKLTATDSDLVVEDGLLRLWCETTLDGASLRIEGGTVNASLLKFEGSAPRIDVLDTATLEVENPQLTFKSDTTISTEDGGHIKIGDSENEAIIETNFETNFPEELRILEFTGKGKIEIFDPLDVPANAIVRNKSGFGIEAGLTLDTYEGDNLENSNIEGLLENTGVIALKSGGLTGNFRNSGWLEATPRQTGDLPVVLAGENRGTIYLNASGMAYHDLTFESGSKLILKDGVSKTIFPASEQSDNTLVFDKGSSIDAVSGNWTITFASNENANLGAKLNIENGAWLDFEKPNTGDATQLTVDSTGSLTLKDLTFKQLRIESNGRVDLTGDIKGVNDLEFRTLNVSAPSFSLKDAKCIGSADENAATSFTFGTSRYVAGDERPHQGTFENVAFENNASVIVDESSLIVTKGDFSISAEMIVLGKLILGSDVSEVPFGNYTLIYLGDKFTKAQLQISSLPAEPISIEPIIEFSNNNSTVTVSSNTVASLIARKPVLVSAPGTLDFGNWIIEDGASCLLKHNPEIDTIGKGAKIQIGAPHPTLGSLSNLPKSNQKLYNLGTLILRDTALDMKGNTFEQQGSFEGNVIGNVQSIRNDVQGVIQLSGNIDIQGDLTMDTTLSLGASPGAGKISGDLTLLPGAEMIVEVGGSEPGTGFDFLEVGGATTLDGTLRLSLINEFTPDIDDAFLFLKSISISGNFAAIDQSNMGRTRRFDLSSGSDGMSLTAKAITIASYADWRSHFFNETDAVNDAISGPTADPDFDGLTNLSEYLHATRPNHSSESPYSFNLSAPSSLVATLQWAKRITDYDWNLESSPDLEAWDSVTFTSQLIDESNEKEYFRIEATTSESDTNAVFYRFVGKATND